MRRQTSTGAGRVRTVSCLSGNGRRVLHLFNDIDDALSAVGFISDTSFLSISGCIIISPEGQIDVL
jgi:hypothetical protein